MLHLSFLCHTVLSPASSLAPPPSFAGSIPFSELTFSTFQSLPLAVVSSLALDSASLPPGPLCLQFL